MSSSSSSGSPTPPPQTKRKRLPDPDPEAQVEESEEIVLSHAEKRRQKKKESKPKPQEPESTAPTKKRKLADGSAADTNPSVHAKAKRQNSVWVGNLSFKTTQDNLRGFFDGVGEITRIHMPMKAGTKSDNMGFAYVDFASPDTKIIAISLSEREFQGRKLLIKDGDDFAGRPAPKAPENAGDDPTNPVAGKPANSLSKTAQKILRVQKQPPAPTLFLGNLGFETTDDSIRQLFEAHRHIKKNDKEKAETEKAEDTQEKGTVEKDVWIRKIRMGTFEDSGACKGFAFVDFTSIEHATDALVNPRNHRLNGRDLVVEYASADAVRRGGGGPRPPKHEGKGQGGNRRENGRSDGFDRQSRSTSRPHRREAQDHRNDGDQPEKQNTEIPTSTTRTRSRDAPPHANKWNSDRVPRGRAKPGAALAQAPRESAAIIPSQGQKIVF
ncbi:hypothetical protein BJ138DRAFT_1010910 [Hygrophoropsis aurantiaca]|uniref:Uncharacterized protein n=1 Tax=Hygrophoropsis aurantiaca TaxID=72124 RepID=A0ACB8A8K0_9AGAM|nr:hypothetical protein BJ138DRAFT_1010910 [Hygrophoropsis aurantiaca]